MTTVSVLEDFVTKYSIPDDGVKELLDIFNQSLVNISTEILNNQNLNSNKKSTKINTSNTSNTSNDDDVQKFSSKKAQEYAIENNLTLEEHFTDMKKVSKKDVENKVREIAKNQKSNSSAIRLDTSTSTSKPSPKKEKIICSGLTKKGEACNKVGCQQPDGAKNKYCFRHAEDWKAFECDSDSSDDDNDHDYDKPIPQIKHDDDVHDDDDEIHEELPIKP
jgi:hypothetical protein